jgi:hypothetical protein
MARRLVCIHVIGSVDPSSPTGKQSHIHDMATYSSGYNPTVLR